MLHQTTLKLKKIEFGDKFLLSLDNSPVYPGVDGAVVYEITEEVEGENGKEPWTYPMHQPFSAKGIQQVNGRNVWGWDGNKEQPTLTPSFLLNYLPAYRIHLYFTKGKINLLSDSTVVLEE
jgi:hypothetical protein